jgi:hypothetical protein
MVRILCLLITATLPVAAQTPLPHDSNQDDTARADRLFIDNGTAKIGIDKAKGAAITWVSWNDQPKNIVNIHDPGRLIQQSYYAGKSLNRTGDGQSEHWSPWPWNPIQGGGIGSWAHVTRFEKPDDATLIGVTIPKLWDMPDEEADAVMHQWTTFEPGMPNVIGVRSRIVCDREPNDRWGPPVSRPQEVPALYFTRNFDRFESYLGGGKWQVETQEAGPPWGKAEPPLNAMACFNADGQGIAIYSPTSGDRWNFGPHTDIPSDDPEGGPCVHIAPISRVVLGPESTYEYRYWLVVGDKARIAAALDRLTKKYSAERGILTNPDNITN